MSELRQISKEKLDEAESPREEKHQLIDDSIDTLESSIDHLENIIDHINGAKLGDMPNKTARDYRPLSQFLNETPDDILRQSERINELRIRLQDMLF